MNKLLYDAYGTGMAIAMAVALVLLLITLIMTAVYFREDLRQWASHRVNLFLYRMQPIWSDTEDECPEWADHDKWVQSLHV